MLEVGAVGAAAGVELLAVGVKEESRSRMHMATKLRRRKNDGRHRWTQRRRKNERQESVMTVTVTPMNQTKRRWFLSRQRAASDGQEAQDTPRRPAGGWLSGVSSGFRAGLADPPNCCGIGDHCWRRANPFEMLQCQA